MRAMKDSGIEWIGQIPQEWSVGKTIFGLEMPITDGPHETPQLYSEGIPFVSAEAVSTGDGRINFDNIRGYISREYYEECCKKYVPRKEDIYMIKSGATTGKVAIVDTDDIFTIWSPLAVFRCNKDSLNSRFLLYTLQSDYFQKQVESKWSFGTQQNIGMRTLERLLICYPSIGEQERIAEYLDTKCADIDALIAAKEKTNTLLKERRQSIIYEAVTKGLNPDAPMKDSGIEWIGQIPENWSTVRVKYTGSYKSGNTITAADVKESGNFPVYGGNGLRGYTDEITHDGDHLLIGRQGALCGNVHMVSGKFWASEHAVVGTINANYAIRFLFYVLDVFDLNRLSTSAAQPGISVEQITGVVIPCPTFVEQQEIANVLDAKCSEVDELISANEATIQKLKEYRQSIIYEAVTGKIEI